ncbi:beta-ureidopropionase [Klebsiella variicola]|uniref:Beta-ureidopropionase n=1 Tax=Klebsiella variicola TaxID=244366 RepID=A0A7H4N3X8_KLEVA|nr:beta-ureidopropionase [Klebsiella variicola]
MIDAGSLDGCYGVLAGVELLQTLHERGLQPVTAIEVIAFSNEEGVRFTPDLLGSRVMVKDISLHDALAAESRSGERVGSELLRIGYAGEADPWQHLPGNFIELHIEQGPLLEATENRIGIVEGVQGHSWWQVEVQGHANHAGTTPMHLRRDAGQAAMRLAQELSGSAAAEGVPNVATVGSFSLEPGAINVVPGLAVLASIFAMPMRSAAPGGYPPASGRAPAGTGRLYGVATQYLPRRAGVFLRHPLPGD